MPRTDRSGFCGASCALALASAVLLSAPCVAGAQSGAPATQAPPAQPPAPPAPAQDHWWERITFSGDFRGRLESFFQEGREERHRGRFRLRLALGAKVNDEIKLGMRLASGDPGDLTSTNQSLTDLFSRKPINIDQAFLAYTPRGLPTFTLAGGKFGYPVARTQLTWDDDINWEGLYEQVTLGATRPVSLKLVAAQSPINEVSAEDDAFMLAEYAEASFAAGRHRVQLSIANYGFRQVDQIAVAVDARGLRNPNSNTITRDANGRVNGFASDFNLVDVIGQVTLATPRSDYPITLLADWVTNTRAVNDGTGVWLVAGVGRAATVGTAAFTYTYARVERDAVLGTFNFSDMPPTNTRMNMVAVSYTPLPRLNVDFIGIFTTPLRAEAAVPRDLLKRLQFDVRVSF